MHICEEWKPLEDKYGNLWIQAQEDPWMPGKGFGDWPGAIMVLNPSGVRHLLFDNGRWYRAFRDRYEAMTAAEVILLSPADASTILGISHSWMLNNSSDPRSHELSGELCEGVKTVIRHFADLAYNR
ncbi:hypothetical protein [Subtercola vilae]|uniref:Uncharacterized protein n=1 Tax=Subtercola vilae TaxID=2056433 RepID=A0A4T2BXA3_9MICO|nr:hypothetical protein [Subtercola vilae]TIH36140.1 hypothetical protein D4765_10160 [Subtercola vilae]